MISRCLYPPLKTCLVERCRSSTLQVQVQDVQNWRWWSSALLDEARLVLSVWFIQTGNVSRRVSQSGVSRSRPHKPPQSPSSSGTVGASWRACVAAPAVGTGEFEVCKALPLAHLIHQVQEAFVEQSVAWWSDRAWWHNLLAWCCTQGCRSWSGTCSLREITSQRGSLHPCRSISAHLAEDIHLQNSTVILQLVFQLVCMLLQRCECKFCIPRSLKNFCWLGCMLFWGTVASIIDSEKNSIWHCLPAKQSDQGGSSERLRYSNFTLKRKHMGVNITINGIQICRVCLHWSVWFQLVFLLCWCLFIQVWITIASTFSSDSEQMLRKYLQSNCIMLEDKQNKTRKEYNSLNVTNCLTATSLSPVPPALKLPKSVIY